MLRIELTAEERLNVATTVLEDMPEEVPAAARIEVDDAIEALDSALQILHGTTSD